MLSMNVFAKSNWVIDYNYDQPYEILNVGKTKNSSPPIFVPRYRLSYFMELFPDFGLRVNIQRDNYFYGINKTRNTEYNSNSKDIGIFKSYEDLLVETGKSNSDSPVWSDGSVSSQKQEKFYIRIGKHHFFKDRRGVTLKLSKDMNLKTTTVEIKLADLSSLSRLEIKLRLDRTPRMPLLNVKRDDVLSVSLAFSF